LLLCAGSASCGWSQAPELLTCAAGGQEKRGGGGGRVSQQMPLLERAAAAARGRQAAAGKWRPAAESRQTRERREQIKVACAGADRIKRDKNA
jgi:hypothetical protein